MGLTCALRRLRMVAGFKKTNLFWTAVVQELGNSNLTCQDLSGQGKSGKDVRGFVKWKSTELGNQ